jgi:hypothetical protein
LFEWWVAPHRQDGLDFHRFMIEHRWAGAGDYRFDLLEPRLQLYGDTAIVSYTFMLSRAKPEGGVEHRTHNESRVLIKRDGQWQWCVHSSPAWSAPFEPLNNSGETQVNESRASNSIRTINRAL